MERKVVVAALLGAGVCLALGAAGWSQLDEDPDGGWPLGGPTVTVRRPPPVTDLIVFVTIDVTEDQAATVGDLLEEDGAVAGYHFMDHDESVEEYNRIFADNPAMLAEGRENPDLIPASFRIDLVEPDSSGASDLAERLTELPGVFKVVDGTPGNPGDDPASAGG